MTLYFKNIIIQNYFKNILIKTVSDKLTTVNTAKNYLILEFTVKDC